MYQNNNTQQTVDTVNQGAKTGNIRKGTPNKGPVQQAPVGPGNPPGPADMKSHLNNPGSKPPGTGTSNSGNNNNNNN